MAQEQLQKLDAMAKPRSEEAVKKAEERKKQRGDKDLLLKYLSMALPYGVKVQTPNGIGDLNTIKLTLFGHELGINIKPTERETFEIKDCKPYLRPLDSMTKEEEGEYDFLLNDGGWGYNVADCCRVIDWLLEHHIDFMGLIPIDSAIEITENNNPYKD